MKISNASCNNKIILKIRWFFTYFR